MGNLVSSHDRLKAGIARCVSPIMPLVRTLVRYGPPDLRTLIWDRIGHTRVVGLPHRFTVRTEHGRFTGDSSDMLSRYVYYFGQWEPGITQLIKQRLRSGDTFVDVGANTGWYTLLAARLVGPTGRVVAIEASPANYTRLQENVTSNRLKNVRLVNEAVWSSEALLSLFQGPASHSGVTTVLPSFAARKSCTLAGHVRARPLSELLTRDEIAKMRVLKVDVEGAEREVLLGLERMLDSVSPDLQIFLELNPSDYDPAEVLRPLLKRGFRAWIMPYQYEPGYCLNFAAHAGRRAFEELLEMPKQQVDVLLSRARP